MKLASLCYLRDGAQTLMLHRNKHPSDYHFGKWNGLGGKLLAGETPEEGARREIKEESGLEVERLEFKGIITFPLFDGVEDWYVFLFNGFATTGTLSNPPEGDLRWVASNALDDLELWQGDRIFLPWLEQEHFFSAKFRYEAGVFIDYSVEFY